MGLAGVSVSTVILGGTPVETEIGLTCIVHTARIVPRAGFAHLIAVRRRTVAARELGRLQTIPRLALSVAVARIAGCRRALAGAAIEGSPRNLITGIRLVALLVLRDRRARITTTRRHPEHEDRDDQRRE
jgi:hypothetical protein